MDDGESRREIDICERQKGDIVLKGLTVCIELWIGGVFMKNDNLQYIGGRKFKFPFVCFDKLNYKDLFGMYGLYGDRSFDVDFFYKKPNLSLDEGLVILKSDVDVSAMYGFYYGSKNITIWCQNNNCVPLKVDDPNVESNNEAYMQYIIDLGCRERQASNVVVDEQLHSDEPAGSSGIRNEGPVDNGEKLHYDHLVENEPPIDDDSYGDEQLATKGIEIGASPSSESDRGKDFESSTESDNMDLEVNTETDGRKIRREKKNKGKELMLENWCTDGEEEDAEFLTVVGSDGDDYIGPKHPSYNESLSAKHLHMVVGLTFKDVTQYREVLADWAIRQGIEITFKKNEKTRVTAVCKNVCDWRLHASTIIGGPIFQVKTMTGKHTCAKAPSNKLATFKYLAKRIENTIRDNPKIAVDKLKKTILRKCKVNTSKYKVYRAKRATVKNLRGQDNAQYLSLWDYCETVRKFNPGSKLILKRDHAFEKPTFGRMYFCLQAMRLGFVNGCRPLIAVDGCFLKTAHGGQLLVAVGKDGNDNLFPIALVVVKVENRENWSWFLSELLEDIGGAVEGKWTFISDKQKGLIEALKEQAPNCEHRYCVRHMYQNMSLKYKGDELRKLLWSAASTSNKNEFASWMKKIEAADRKENPQHVTAAEWLGKIPPVHWARSHFSSSCLCDVIVNNMAESFNSYVLEARDMPIISMFDRIRRKLMVRMQEKRIGMEKYDGNICPNILAKIRKNQDMCRDCSIFYCGLMEYEIDTGTEQYIVDLEKRDAYLRTYAHIIHGVPGESDYVKTDFEPLQPPPILKANGRPKKKRRKGAGEIKGSLTRRGLTHTCSKCLQQGHNKKTCTPTNPRCKDTDGGQRKKKKSKSVTLQQQTSTVVGTQGPTQAS